MLRRFWQEEDGIGIVEIVLILVILIGLVVIFKNEISAIFKNVMDRINKDSDSLYEKVK